MKPAKKKDKEVVLVDRPLPSARKRMLKPWILEYMITDPELLNKHSWFKNNKEPNVWIKDSWMKFLSIEHAIRELNKIARSYNFKQEPITNHWKWAGKKFQLVNQDTNEIIPLLITEKEIYAERKTGGDPTGSTEGTTEVQT